MMPAQILQPAPAKQECSSCRHINKCRSRYTIHHRPLSDRNDMINLLVCRLQLDINKDESAKTLLQLLKPGMIKLITSARRRTITANINFTDMLADMQSYTVECILTKYRIGELNPITNFLFDIKTGYLPKWTQFYIAKHKRASTRYSLVGISPFRDDSSDDRDEYNAISHPEVTFNEEDLDIGKRTEMTTVVMDMINDGVTLTTNEYRVFQFCLSNVNDDNNTRMIDGLHIHLAKMMGVSRPRITRLYAKAREKIRGIVGRVHRRQ